MNYLLDTHMVLWAAIGQQKLSAEAEAILRDPASGLWFSAVTVWEVAIKRSLNRPDFRVDAGPLRAGLLQTGYLELPIESRHVMALVGMQRLHADPFDRLLLAQALAEGLTLLTADQELARYDGPIKVVSRR